MPWLKVQSISLRDSYNICLQTLCEALQAATEK
ncbi:hypothetical protein C7399_118156 [Paraburkholderia tropica]|uniref:Uncharacterized protein n=1 Tax=Paraburkholderia tropica TaxID=92647 RepID=A0ABX5MKR4_9BURK|nr:hypothetical protein C7400_117158 [Paraburkholderia tropica]PZW76531.1 hypothetical protein C7399_118156 [Paraburkholderia tropica]